MSTFWLLALVFAINIGILALIAIWMFFVVRGKQFALRDRLVKADAIVVLAGTRGNLAFLNGKVQTSVRLYKEGWAPSLVCVGRFSAKVTETPTLIPLEELQAAAAAGRIQEKDCAVAASTWDTGLGAHYMRDQAIIQGVPPEAVLVEAESLHTRENAEFTAALLKQHQMKRIILVTSPFHQLRTYLTFAKVLSLHHMAITNYYADTGEWHALTWFFSRANRKLVRSERNRITLYRKKGDL